MGHAAGLVRLAATDLPSGWMIVRALAITGAFVGGLGRRRNAWSAQDFSGRAPQIKVLGIMPEPVAARVRVHAGNCYFADCAVARRCDTRTTSSQNSPRQAFTGFHVAFSLFGKKDKTPTKKNTAAGATEKPGGQALKPAPPARTVVKPDAAPPGDEDLFLDFAQYVPSPCLPRPRNPEPPKRAKPAAPEQGAATESRGPILKPGAADVPPAPESRPAAVPPAQPRAPASAPAVKPVPAQPPAEKPAAPVTPMPKSAVTQAKNSADESRPTGPGKSPVATPLARPERKPPAPASAAAPSVREPPPDSIMGIEVRGSTADTAPVIEEAAILFANAQSLQALTALTHAVRHGGLGASALQTWLMLFDLYQHLDMKAEFEALGMEFLVEFERSPPVWLEPKLHFDPALATGGVGYCALTGVLSDQSASQFEQLRTIGEGQYAIRIDVAKLEGVDQSGCARLLEALQVLKSEGNEIILTGEAQLLRLLDARCRMRDTTTDRVFWSLLLEILRRVGLKEKFEEAAVNYAVTYEVSPPSWESQTAAKPRPDAGAEETESAPEAFRLSGDVTGADEALPKRLYDWAATNSPLVIDMSATRRVDFVSAGQLLNVFTKLHQDGVTIQIRGANALVAALFGVMGMAQVVRIILNR